jgi:hypothetical protein
MSVRFGIVKPPQIEHGLDCERKEKGKAKRVACCVLRGADVVVATGIRA